MTVVRATSTRANPGAFQPGRIRGVRQALGEAARAVSRGRYREAGLGLLVDLTNVVEARAGEHLKPRFRCSCCGHETHAFYHKSSGHRIAWNSACPGCDSRSRHRGLAVLLAQLLDEHPRRRALHFAPEAVLRGCFSRPGLVYETADLYLQDVTHPGVDVMRVPFADGAYDLVLCNHVLEHVPDDRLAMRQLARILDPEGVAIITVPGDFSRRETTLFHGELPNGHYRDYGLDVVDTLRSTFTTVRVVDLHTLDRDTDGMSRGIRPRDLAFVCTHR